MFYSLTEVATVRMYANVRATYDPENRFAIASSWRKRVRFRLGKCARLPTSQRVLLSQIYEYVHINTPCLRRLALNSCFKLIRLHVQYGI